MAQHTPHTYSTGDTITAALLNQAEADLAAAIPKADADAAYDAKGAAISAQAAAVAAAATDATTKANAAQAAAVQRANHTGTQSADSLTDGTTNKAYTAAEKTKLAGVATGATANVVGAAGSGAGNALSANDPTTTNSRTPTAHTHPIADLTATGTRDATTFLRGDGTWSTTPAAAGAVDASTTTKGLVQLTGDLAGTATAPTVPGLAGKAALLTPTATKTAAYTAAVGDLAVMNVAGGATALTLPTAPADKAQVAFLAIGATAAVPLTVTPGGADTIGPSGATSVTAVLANEVTVYQYQAASTRWLPAANVKPQTALDARYGLTSNAVAQWSTSSDGTTRQVVAQAGTTFATVGGFPWQPITVDPGKKFQEILGFGCAITDSSAYLLQAKLTQAQRAALLAEVFDPAQGNCSLVRISMGASDYSQTAYTYDDQPSGVTDPNLNGFALGSADQQYKIATLREILRINPRVRIVAAPWSPPAWMKTAPANGFVGSSVATGNFAALASYFVKFVQAYASYGIPIYAVTPQNEPTQVNTWPSTLMTAADQTTFIGTYLGPAFDTAGITTRIWAFDDSWATTYPNTVLANATAAPFVDGVGHHWYGGVPEYMAQLARTYPTKGQYVTEACHTTGSPLTMATAYAKLFIGSIRNQAGCVILWGLALDENGGPRTLSTQVIHGLYTIPSSGSGAYTRNVDFYALTQTSRFVKPGAVRVAASNYPTGVQSVAYLNPDNSVVLVAYNSSASAVTTQVIDARRGQAFPLTLPAGEVSTLVWSGVGAGTGSLAATVPAAPTLALTGKTGRVQVTITPPTSAVPLSGYTLSRGTATGQETILAALPPTATSYTDYTSAGTYFYTLTAYSAAGASSVSAEVSAAATAATAPAATVLAATGTATTATLTWTVPDDGGSPITSYQVFRGTTAGVSTAGTVLATVPVVSGATYADTGLTAGTTYYYRVRAVNAVGNATDSNEVSYLASTRPATPATTAQPTLWLRADQITGVSNGAAVTSWADTLGHTAVTSTGATAPVFVASAVNSLPAVQLRTASSQRMTVPFTIGAENITIFLVMRVPTSATQSFLAAATSDTKVNGTPTMYRDVNNGGLVHAQVQGTASSNCASGSGLGTNTWAIAAVSYDTAGNSHAEKSVVNGGTIGTFTPSAYTAGSAAGIAIGGVAADAGDLDIAELIVMPACLSDADRHSWTTYLGSIYNITVGAN